MADIGITTNDERRANADPINSSPVVEPCWDLIELLFFAYRDFVGDPDDVLATLGFGRAHHRVLHFINRNPGMKVADLLDVLKIPKQPLSRIVGASALRDVAVVDQLLEHAARRRQRSATAAAL